MRKRKVIISILMALVLLFKTTGAIVVSGLDLSEDEIYEYNIPDELISEENIELYGHVTRVFAAESELNEICILNEDGSNSVYIFDYPVKYRDDDGKIKDKSNKLHVSKRNNYLYVNDDNDIKSYFPKKITKHPVITTVGDYEIKIGIVTNSNANKKGELIDDKLVFYDKAFGDDTAIRYMTEFDGYKEEIILYSLEAPKQYSFEIECDGLTIQNQKGTLNYIDEKTGDTVFTSNPLYIYDSSVDEKSYIETDLYIEQVDDFKYLLTVLIDETFLSQEGLTYPVYIDPSIKYNDSDYICDAPIYTARADEPCGNHLVSYLGLHNSNYGVGRLLVKFPEMRESNSVFRNLSADEVISVKLYLYNAAMGTNVSTIKAYQFLGDYGWNESTVTWNNCSPNSLGNLQSSVTLSNTWSGYYIFDITEAAKSWVGNSLTATYRSQQGIIVLNANEVNQEYTKCIRMADFGPSYKPYIVVSYTNIIENGTYFIQNAETSRYMDVEGPSTAEGAVIQQWDFHTGNQAKWNIVRQSDGYYTIQSVYSNKYVGVENNSIANNAAIKQYASNTEAGTRWGFSVSGSGNYIITAKSAETYSRVLSVPAGLDANGTDLIQYTYSDNNDYKDEWIFHNINDYKGVLDYWNDTGETVGYWSDAPNVYSEKIETDVNFYYDTGVNSAKSQWSSALGTTFYNVNKDLADIESYGLTVDQYKTLTGVDWNDGITGITNWTYYNMGYVIYGNDLKNLKRQAHATIYIIHDTGSPRSEAALKKTVTHEFGHALGYFGHSPSPIDVMYKSSHEDFQLKNSEINHLGQVYNLMN